MSASSMQVLIVSARAEVRSVVETAVRRHRWPYAVAESAQTALAAQERDQYPLVIVDGLDADGSGFELCCRLRALPTDCDPFILVLMPRDALAGPDNCASDFAGWPCQDELLELRLALAERRVDEIARRVETERNLRTLIHNAPIVIAALDRAGRATMVEGRGLTRSGLRANDLVGRNLCETWRYVPACRGAAVLERVLAGEVVARTAELNGAWFDVRHLPLHDTHGEIVGAIVVATDVTEQRHAESARAQTETCFRTFIDACPDGVMLASDGRVRFMNRAGLTLLGYERPEEVIGRAPSDLCHPDERALARARAQSLERSARPNPPVELRLLRKDGGVVTVESISLPIVFDGQGAIMEVTRDLTERRQLQARLLLADRMASVGTLAAGVAHEINNPLSYVVANLSFLVEGLGELELAWPEAASRLGELREALQEAREGAERVRHIVRDLRTFSRADEDRRGPVDVCQVLESSLSLVWNEIRHRARLTREYGEVPPALANQARLGQVFVNLLTNAVQAIPEGAAGENEIRLVTRANSDGRVVIEVCDTGCGIAPEVLPRVFDPFFTTKPVGVGTGLGLSICHGIVTALGGEITVDSELGRGATFRVALPPAGGKTAPALVAAAAPARADGRAHRRGRVLLIDDEIGVGVAVRRLLEAQHEVLALSSAREALARLRTGERYDVILCDLMMPEMTGMEWICTGSWHGWCRPSSGA